MSLRPGNTASFEEMLQRWRAIGNAVSNLNLGPPAPETNAIPLELSPALIAQYCCNLLGQILGFPHIVFAEIRDKFFNAKFLIWRKYILINLECRVSRRLI